MQELCDQFLANVRRLYHNELLNLYDIFLCQMLVPSVIKINMVNDIHVKHHPARKGSCTGATSDMVQGDMCSWWTTL